MQQTSVQEIIVQIAARHRVDPAELHRDIEAALAAGRRNPSPLAQARWESLGRETTPDDLLLRLAALCVLRSAKGTACRPGDGGDGIDGGGAVHGS